MKRTLDELVKLVGQRERISASLGGRCLTRDDMIRVENRTEKINKMRAEILARMM